MTIDNLVLDRSEIPDHVYDDVRKLRNVIAVDMLRVESGPDDGWTLRITDDTDRSTFESIASLVEETVSSDDVRPVYERSTRRGWLVQVRYDG